MTKKSLLQRSMTTPMGDLPTTDSATGGDPGVNTSSDFVFEDETAEINLAPTIQSYLARNTKLCHIFGIPMPMTFERANAKKFWFSQFDSDILENQYKITAANHLLTRFRFGILYVFIFSLFWQVYFVAVGTIGLLDNWHETSIIFSLLMLTSTIFFFITFTGYYMAYPIAISTGIIIGILSLSLSLLIYSIRDANESAQMILSQNGHSLICLEFLVILYTVTPLPLGYCVPIGIIYSITFEVMNFYAHNSDLNSEMLIRSISVRALAHLSVHLFCFHINIMTCSRVRGMFIKVGQSMLVRRQLEMEKQFKEKMIHSVMPPKLAKWLMQEQVINKNVNSVSSVLASSSVNIKPSVPINPNDSTQKFDNQDIKTMFRPFTMYSMDNVSILFADIVGFTKLSSNKSAEEIVNILNDLFERFDELCTKNGCEKISTLGDCYYCVAGCPEPNISHAKCCVEMGLSMIVAIEEFNLEYNENVNMRVGVHTGTVLCGIVGKRRFKFDVWGNDVNYANKMESTGMPGKVHISSETMEALNHFYLLIDGPIVDDKKTYFVKFLNSPKSMEQNFNTSDSHICQRVDIRLVISPAVSPESTDIPEHTHTSDAQCSSPKHGKNYDFLLAPLKPQVKASSLPSILDSDGDGDDKQDLNNDLSSKSPVSVASHSKYTQKIKNWKIPKFLRKHTQPITNDNKSSDSQVNSTNECVSSSNTGYQQVPTVIEPQDNNFKTSKKNRNLLDDFFGNQDIESIDIRSYLSSSRNNMSLFGRSSSYRSQYGRRHHNEAGVIPRARSSTVSQADLLLLRPRDSLLPPPNTTVFTRSCEDSISISPSIANSRKDSGIRSNSRQSSIQQQIYALDRIDTQHIRRNTPRLSGYFTHTSSSESVHKNRYQIEDLPYLHLTEDDIIKLRKQSDLQMIKCIQYNSHTGFNYFATSALNKFTLSFKSKELEKEYRNSGHRDLTIDLPPTLTTPIYNILLDLFITLLLLVLISLGLFIIIVDVHFWVPVFICFLTINIICMVLCMFRIWLTIKQKKINFYAWIICLINALTSFYSWNFFGAILLCIPVMSVLVNFSCSLIVVHIMTGDESLYILLLCLGYIHMLNYTQLNWIMKNGLAIVLAVLFLLMTSYFCISVDNISPQHLRGNSPPALCAHEIFINVGLLLILIFFLNRELELSTRMTFHCKVMAKRDQIKVQNLRNQADMLLDNIIPRHVADQLKLTAQYSENHKNVGVMFASIVNFTEMYDESYLMGKEYLRVLNELISDFDELLDRSEFCQVEKIKCIGSTYMAASGLNPRERKKQENPNEHLYQLVEFGFAMLEVIEIFNHNLLEFNLILRIGMSAGDLTAGVIGTSKLYYDVWGDVVNMASRMDTTGEPKHIQVDAGCAERLQQRYNLIEGRVVYVKGKSDMNVFLVGQKHRI